MSESYEFNWKVEGKITIFMNDMMNTAGTITNGADAIIQSATSVCLLLP